LYVLWHFFVFQLETFKDLRTVAIENMGLMFVTPFNFVMDTDVKEKQLILEDEGRVFLLNVKSAHKMALPSFGGEHLNIGFCLK
jgi:hypothetical protein